MFVNLDPFRPEGRDKGRRCDIEKRQACVILPDVVPGEAGMGLLHSIHRAGQCSQLHKTERNAVPKNGQ